MDVCIFSKHGFCKNRDNCSKKHFKEVCSKAGCNGAGCDTRHPRKCWNFDRSNFCKFGSYCAYSHGGSERVNTQQMKVIEELTKEKRKLQQRVEQLEVKISLLEVKENELMDRAQKAVTSAVGELARKLTYHMFPMLKRVEALEFHMRFLHGLTPTPPRQLVGKVNSNWCGDCGAQWVYRNSLDGEDCGGDMGDVCICGQPCEQCWGSNPQTMEPPFSWNPDPLSSDLTRLFKHLGDYFALGPDGSWKTGRST